MIHWLILIQWHHQGQHVPVSHITLHKHVFFFMAASLGSTCFRRVEQAAAAGCVPTRRVVTHHVGAGAGKCHELGVELQTGDGPRVLAVQQRHLHPALRVPHVDLAVLRACGAKAFGFVRKKKRTGATHVQNCHLLFGLIVVQWTLWTIDSLLVSVEASSLLAFCGKLWKLSRISTE